MNEYEAFSVYLARVYIAHDQVHWFKSILDLENECVRGPGE